MIADGTDGSFVTTLRANEKKTGATLKVIAPKVEGATGVGGTRVDAECQLAGGPSVRFDTIELALTQEAAQQLASQPGAVSFVQDAFSHLKVIGYTPAAAVLLTKAGVIPDAGVISIDSNTPQPYLDQAAKGRIWAREAKVRSVL